jgi:hypothetical protein
VEGLEDRMVLSTVSINPVVGAVTLNVTPGDQAQIVIDPVAQNTFDIIANGGKTLLSKEPIGAVKTLTVNLPGGQGQGATLTIGDGLGLPFGVGEHIQINGTNGGNTLNLNGRDAVVGFGGFDTETLTTPSATGAGSIVFSNSTGGPALTIGLGAGSASTINDSLSVTSYIVNSPFSETGLGITIGQPGGTISSIDAGSSTVHFQNKSHLHTELQAVGARFLDFGGATPAGLQTVSVDALKNNENVDILGSYAGVQTDVNTKGASETVNVGLTTEFGPGQGTLSGLGGDVQVTNLNTTSTPTLNINDQASTALTRYFATVTSAGPQIVFQPLSGAQHLIKYSSNVNVILAGSITTLGDEYAVQQTVAGSPLTINAAPTDIVDVGSQWPAILSSTLVGIKGTVTVNGANFLRINDAGSTQAAVWTIHESSVSGVAPAAVNFHNVAQVKIEGSSGVNTYNLTPSTQTAAFSTEIILDDFNSTSTPSVFNVTVDAASGLNLFLACEHTPGTLNLTAVGATVNPAAPAPGIGEIDALFAAGKESIIHYGNLGNISVTTHINPLP